MKRILILALLSLAALPMSASPVETAGEGAPGAQTGERSILFHGGTIHTAFSAGDGEGEAGPKATALLTRGMRIVDVGTLDTLAATEEGKHAERVDLRGAHAFPGFQDAHGHIEGYGAFLEEVDLTGSDTFAELIRRVQARAAEVPAGTWILGRGWDQTLWPGQRFPHHRELSAATPDHPVLVDRVDGHAALANALALEAAGLDGEELPDDPVGGSILRESGEATGVLIDTAIGLVGRHVPAPGPDARRRRVLRAQEALLATGLTCVHDMGVDRSAATELYPELQGGGDLKMRVVQYVHGNGFTEPRQFEGLAAAPDGRDVHTVRGIKFMVDGALGSRGAALIAPYSDDPESRGLARFDVDAFGRQVTLAAKAGLQPATHAIGDRANRMVLDAYLRAAEDVDGFRGLRPRIEHAQVVAPADFRRFGEQAIVASMQPTHATSDMRWVPARLGDDRAAGSYAWRTISEATPVPLAFGSDFPVERPHPLEGLYAALTRQDRSGGPDGGFFPEERLSANAALAAFTSGAAFAAGQEDRRGRLARGYCCDMTIVDVDLSRLDASTASAALDARVVMTVVNGEVLFRAEER